MPELVPWLEDQFKARQVTARVHEDLIREDGNWYYVPVYVEMRDAYDKATLLQEIENAWEKQGNAQSNLLLTPTAN